MSSRAISYTWSDAWLFVSVNAAGGAGSQLTDVIATGDYLNHAIFTYQELDAGLARLQAGGLLSVRRQRVHLTPAGRSLRETATRGPGGLFGIVQRVAQKLGATAPGIPADPNAPDPHWSSGLFSPSDFDAACQRYSASMSAMTAAPASPKPAALARKPRAKKKPAASHGKARPAPNRAARSKAMRSKATRAKR